jgi:spermidine synthase
MKTYIYCLTAFVAGFITLSLELLGFRALAPYFGYSIYVFGSLIGLILLALSLGYLLGGMLGKAMGEKKFFLWMLTGGIYITLAAGTYNTLLSSLQDLSVITGSILATATLFGFPMIIFAATSPYVVGRIVLLGKDAGRAAGLTAAAGTMGGLCGTFLTSFLLLPYCGTRATFFLNAFLGIVLPVVWLMTLRFKKGLFALIIPIIAIAIPPKQSLAIIAAQDSPYAHLEVVDYGDFIALRAERRSGAAYSVIMKNGQPEDKILYNLFATAPLISSGNRVLLLGLGAGTLPLVHETFNPAARITGVEIDPNVIALGKKYFKLADRKNIDRIITEDVRPFLVKDKGTYDVIEVDLFKGGVEIPFYLATKEFFALTAARLTERGVLAMNIYDIHSDKIILRSILQTLEAVYPYVYEVPADNGSSFVAASKSAISNIDTRSIKNAKLKTIVEYFNTHITPAEETHAVLLTDDRAPLEQLYGQPS